MWGNMMDWGGGFGLWHLLWWAIGIAVIVMLVRLFTGTDRSADRNSADGALRILKERYARGEINRDEFEQRKRDLG